VVAYLKFFTFLERGAIDELAAVTSRAPEKRDAQRVLAREVTGLVHGSEQVARAERASAMLFGEDIATLDVDDVMTVFADVPSSELPAGDVSSEGVAIVDLLVRVQLVSSKSEARRLVQSGGVYLNNSRLTDPQARVRQDQAIGGRLLVLRKGQRQQHLVRIG